VIYAKGILYSSLFQIYCEKLFWNFRCRYLTISSSDLLERKQRGDILFEGLVDNFFGESFPIYISLESISEAVNDEYVGVIEGPPELLDSLSGLVII